MSSVSLYVKTNKCKMAVSARFICALARDAGVCVSSGRLHRETRIIYQQLFANHVFTQIAWVSILSADREWA